MASTSKRLTYSGLIDDARSAGLVVDDRGYGRYRIVKGDRWITVYLIASSWAFTDQGERYHPTQRCRLPEAYEYLGLVPALASEAA